MAVAVPRDGIRSFSNVPVMGNGRAATAGFRLDMN
jgi:hypothetical protein